MTKFLMKTNNARNSKPAMLTAFFIAAAAAFFITANTSLAAEAVSQSAVITVGSASESQDTHCADEESAEEISDTASSEEASEDTDTAEITEEKSKDSASSENDANTDDKAAEADAQKSAEDEAKTTSETAAPATCLNHLQSLGIFKTTAYCPCPKCSGSYGRRTCTGAVATVNHTIAVDPRVIPLGSKVMINGTVYTAEDRGGGVKGNHIDVFFESHSQSLQYGVRSAEVFLVSAA